MEINYNQYLFAKLLAEVDEDWNNLEYDLQFEEIPMRYKWFQNSGYNKEELSEYDTIMEYLHSRRALKLKVIAHDFTFEFSDDTKRWNEGRVSLAEITGLSTLFVKEDFRHLWNSFAPVVVQI